MESIEINGYDHYRYIPQHYSPVESLQKSRALVKQMSTRRSIRHFSTEGFPIEIIENLIKIASSAPSGANKQPWTFCVVQNPEIKKEIRKAAENEEKLSYHNRMNAQWLKDLAHLGTTWEKPFLEEAPYLIIVFKQSFGLAKDASKMQHYYVNESVGLACGFLISALHQSGLATLTHTPSPMNFLSEILQRPKNEKPFLLLPVGYPAEKVFVPNITKKTITEVMKIY